MRADSFYQVNVFLLLPVVCIVFGLVYLGPDTLMLMPRVIKESTFLRYARLGDFRPSVGEMFMLYANLVLFGLLIPGRKRMTQYY